MEDQTTMQARTPSGAERDYLIRQAREALADYDDFLASRGRYVSVSKPLGAMATSGLAASAAALLRLLGEDPEVTG